MKLKESQVGLNQIHLEADVLVLGAGAAGCMAAIGAIEKGCSKVIIVDKGPIDSCGCCGAGQDHFAAHLNSGPEWDSDDVATKWYSSPGWGVNAHLVEKTFTKVVGSMVKRLEDLGIEFFRESNGDYYRTQALGQPGPWWMMMKNGKYLKRKLASKVREKGAIVTEHVMITKLLTSNGRVIGALGFNKRNGDLYSFAAKSVVLAMGSHQSRWSTNSTNNPFNIWQNPSNTGTQIVVAFAAGAKLKNLENTVVTTLPKGFGAPAMNAFGGMGAHMINAFKENFMAKHHPLGEQAPRAYHILAEYEERFNGNDPLYIDVRHLADNDMDHLINNLLTVDKNTFLEYLQQRGIDLKEKLLEVEIGEYSGGGNIVTDNNCESNVKGLFGLAFSGMLSTALCGGLVAGFEAAESSLKNDLIFNFDQEIINFEKARLNATLNRKEGYSPKRFEKLIRQIMNYYMGYSRNKIKLEIALEKLDLIEKLINEIKAENLHELLRAQEAIHLLIYCKLMIRATIERKGMKGFYRMSDTPNVDKNLRSKDVVISQENNVLKAMYVER